VYGPCGTWDGGREKLQPRSAGKVIEAKDAGSGRNHDLGRRHADQEPSCTSTTALLGDRQYHALRGLIATPINLGSSELIAINRSGDDRRRNRAEVRLKREYDPNAPRGVAAATADNTMIQPGARWEPKTPFRDGLRRTVRVDRAAVLGPKRREEDGELRGKLPDVSTDITEVIGRIPYRMASLAVVSTSPSFRGTTRRRRGPWSWSVSSRPSVSCTAAGMADRDAQGRSRLWNGGLPERGSASARQGSVRRGERAPAPSPSGSQDMIGSSTQAVTRLDYDADFEGGDLSPTFIESSLRTPRSPAGSRRGFMFFPWPASGRLQPPRRGRTSILSGSGGSGRPARTATVRFSRRTLAPLGASMNECMRCWEAILPQTVRHPALTVDLPGDPRSLPAPLPGRDVLWLRRRLSVCRLRGAGFRGPSRSRCVTRASPEIAGGSWAAGKAVHGDRRSDPGDHRP